MWPSLSVKHYILCGNRLSRVTPYILRNLQRKNSVFSLICSRNLKLLGLDLSGQGRLCIPGAPLIPHDCREGCPRSKEALIPEEEVHFRRADGITEQIFFRVTVVWGWADMKSLEEVGLVVCWASYLCLRGNHLYVWNFPTSQGLGELPTTRLWSQQWICDSSQSIRFPLLENVIFSSETQRVAAAMWSKDRAPKGGQDSLFLNCQLPNGASVPALPEG